MRSASDPEVRIRVARPAEYDAMLTLWERAVRATHDFLSEDDIVALRPAVAAELTNDTLAWWVLAPEDAPPIGFLCYAPGKIEGLFIDPAFHGRGGGRRLVAHAQTLEGTIDGALFVDVNEGNPAARRFYESLGFREFARSAHDDAGRPFPLIHMRRESSGGPT